MILVDREIRDAVSNGSLVITQFADDCVQPASYDLRIGKHIFVPTSSPDRPIDLSANGRVFKLPPYGTAVLTTHEDLALPDTIVGRIGLKSGLARMGLVASTGPQIDPGFKGKLFVSIFNLTAASHIFTFLETFLTIEFQSLEKKPDESYHGSYQGQYTITPEVADALARLEGLTLTQMQSQFTELAQHVREWTAMAPRVDEFLRKLDDHTRAIARLTENLSNGHSPPAQIPTSRPLRRVGHKQAEKEILALFKERGRLHYSDLVEALQLDIATVIRATKTLEREGLIEGVANGGSKRQRVPKKSRS